MKSLILVITLALLSPCVYGQQLIPGHISKIDGKPGHEIIHHNDGGTLIFGRFDHVNGEYIGRLAKVDHTGKMVTGFKKVYTDNIISCLRVQNDGKMLISGPFTIINGNPTRGLLRLNADGSIDPSFTSALEQVGRFELQQDGRIITISASELVRLNADGTLDGSFSMQNYVPSYTEFAIAPDGHIYFTSGATLHKLKPNGDDATFFVGTGVNSGIINALAVQRDGKILIGGFFQSYNGVAATSIVRVNADGTIDPTFGVGTGPSGQVFKFVERQNGNLLVGGQFSLYNNQPGNLVELKPDGTLHKVVAVVEANWITSIIEAPDQKITIAGEFHKVNGTIRYWTARFNSDYTSNDAFVPHISYANTNGRVLEIRKNGAVITGGYNHEWLGIYNGQQSIRRPLVQFNTLGGYDHSFTAKGIVTPMWVLDAMFIQNDDKIVISGDARGFDQPRLARLNADGSLDNSFAIGTGPGYYGNFAARIYCIRQRGDVLYISGLMQKFNETPVNSMIALNLDGSIRSTFQLPANTMIGEFDFQSDGKIIALGYVPSSGGTVKRIVRINTDGTLDGTFSESAKDMFLGDLQIDNHDKIYLNGSFTVNGTPIRGIVRLLPNGDIDPGFSTGTGFDSEANTICLLPNGNLAVGGRFSSYKGQPARTFVILDATGENVTPSSINFGPNSYATVIRHSNGALFLAGRFVKEDNTDVYGNVKIALSPPVIPDAAPANLKVSLQTAGAFNIQWEDQSANELAFVLERSSENSSQFTAIDTVSSNVTSVTDAGVQANLEYFYRVKAVNDAGGSAYSNITSFRWVPVSTLLPESENVAISVYPVPARDVIFATMPEKTSTGNWWLVSTSGERIAVYGEAYDDGVVSIDVQSVAPGMYVLQHIESKTTWQKRIIKQ